MKFLVNGYNLRDKPVGIANVTINFINSFSSYEDIEIIILLSTGVTHNVLSRINQKKNIEFRIVPPKHSMLWFMFSLPKYINKIQPDLLWSPTPLLPFFIHKKIKWLITIHDFVSKEYRNTMTLAGRIVTRICEKKTILSADYIWCVSEYTKNKLLEYYPNKKKNSIIVGSAPDGYFKKISTDTDDKRILFSKYNIIKPFLLFVGSLEPRKNLTFLLNIFKVFAMKNDFQLVIVGARKWGKTNIADIINTPGFPKERIVFTDFIYDSELRLLYNTASCYVSTSLNEGFGLPQAEAMSCSCPVVTAHNSAMIEVVEDAGVTVKSWDVRDWCNAIEYVLNNSEIIIKKQNERLKRYDWKIVAESAYKLINNLV